MGFLSCFFALIFIAKNSLAGYSKGVMTRNAKTATQVTKKLKYVVYMAEYGKLKLAFKNIIYTQIALLQAFGLQLDNIAVKANGHFRFFDFHELQVFGVDCQ